MSVLSRVLAELERPDDMGRDWYAWTTNQLGHAFAYMALAMIFNPLIAGGLAVVKELSDGLRADTRQGWRDCAVDLFFSLCGVALFVLDDRHDLWVLAAMAAALAAGIVKRVRAASEGA